MKKKVEFDEFVKDYRKKQDGYLSATGEDSDFFARYKVHLLATWLESELKEPNQILDFGCGDGLMTSYLAYYFNNSKVFGADISQYSIDLAKQAFPKLSFSCIDSELEFKEESFDIVVAAGVFHHIPFCEHSFWINQMIRCLKPGGKLVIFEINPLNPGSQYIFRNNPMEDNAKMLFPWYTKKLLRVYGEVKTRFFCFFPGFLSHFRFLERYLEIVPLGGLYATLLTKK